MTQISVVIPSYNAGALLERCIAALRAAEATGGPLHEIVVVDDASTDGSAARAESMGARVIRMESNGGPGKARNAGAELASGDVLWFVDADVEVAPDALRVIHSFIDAQPNFGAAIGSYDEEPSAQNAVSQFKNLFHHFVHQQAGDTVSSFWSGCGIIRADLFRELGGFDTSFWEGRSVEDIYLGYQLSRDGRRIRVIHDLYVKHNKRWTLASLVKADVFHRAVPWTVMLLRDRRRGGSELNVGGRARMSVVSVYLALVAVVASVWWKPSLILAPVFLVTPLVLHLKLLALFQRRRGSEFLIRAIPLLWFYFFYCGVGYGLGIFHYVRTRWSARNRTGDPKNHAKPL